MSCSTRATYDRDYMSNEDTYTFSVYPFSNHPTDVAVRELCETLIQALSIEHKSNGHTSAATSLNVLTKNLKPTRIIRNKDNLVVFWNDGDKTVVKCHDEGFDAEKGIAMALARKVWGRADTLRYIKSIEIQKRREK